jgi:hypothetical protein
MTERSSSSLLILRILAALIALPFTAYAALALLAFLRARPGAIFSLIVGAPSLMAALLLWWFVLRGHIAQARTRMAHIFVGAALVGGISFIAGFVGPIVFMPQSNQGPLLGIFFTGPIGFTVGGILGAVYSWSRFHGTPAV